MKESKTAIKSKKISGIIPRRFTVIGFLACLFIFFTHFTNPPLHDRNKQINEYFQALLQELQSDILSFKNISYEKPDTTVLRRQFAKARFVYKRLAVLSEYFNVYETRYLNGPAIDRVEDDNPHTIIPPHGFQHLETLLYTDWEEVNFTDIQTELDVMTGIIKRLTVEQDRHFKFTDELVWDAIRSSVHRLTTLGISGFDSPIANLSFSEANATLAGIKDILSFFKEDIDKKNAVLFTKLISAINNTAVLTETANDFNSFDRMAFIRKYLDPLYTQLIQTRKLLGIKDPEGLYPVHFEATSVFAEDFFNINFYSPLGEYSITKEKIELGKKLFYDPALSGNKKRSCATCHKPEMAFTDGLKTAKAINNKSFLSRNTPTLWNSALQTKQFFDSRTSVLENQLDEVVHNEKEMKGSLKKSVEELQKNSEYASLFKKAYPESKEPVAEYNIANAISSYVRSLVALNSRFDQYMRGNDSTLTRQEVNGFNLFMGKAKCGTCHFLPLFNGLVPPDFTDTESEVLGVPKTKNKRKPLLDADAGKIGFTGSPIHQFAFKTPALRNIALTAPYMHNGVFSTLEEVMEFYNNGGGAGLKIAPVNQTLPPDKLNLTKKEISDIISFMKALTDTVSHCYW